MEIAEFELDVDEHIKIRLNAYQKTWLPHYMREFLSGVDTESLCTLLFSVGFDAWSEDNISIQKDGKGNLIWCWEGEDYL